MAERIARTEAARAWADGFAEKYMDDDSVVAFQWKLVSRHPKFDICDLYAEANLYGLGKGIYPKNATPRLPVHPHCLCHLAPVYRSELKGKKAVDQLEEGGRAWLENQSLYHRQQILGIQGTKAFANRDSWTKWARNYTGARLAGRPKDLPESLKPYLHDGKIKIEEVSKCLPDESLSEFDKRIHDYLESPYCTKVFTDRQKIHIKGTDLYNPDKSYYMNAESLNNIDIKELLLSGKIKLTKAGDWNKKVLVHHPGIKGVVVHQYGSDTVLTEYSLVHVSDKGVHMVPKEAES
ncbi:polymorphic toxin type 50 domain-containing protein [Mitsuokella multacida]|uniref:polymorphic toxin type 50 domain-containing protein n=1 Tax=Mitsuokella multacida TaxID=52226 RepID=UPI003FED5CAB